MKTLSTTVLLSIMFLSAGAFAGVNHKVNPTVTAKGPNITIAVKNQTWPVAGRITVDPCNANRCIDI